MISSKEIIKIFSYDLEEQAAFDYIRIYMMRIESRLQEIEQDEKMLKRFALAGLFLTYRAFNHGGDLMTTELEYYNDESIHHRRLKVFKEFFQFEIRNSSHYLDMIGLSKLDIILLMFRLKKISTFLYNYVLRRNLLEI